MIDDIHDVIEIIIDAIDFIIDLFKYKKSKNNDEITDENDRIKGR